MISFIAFFSIFEDLSYFIAFYLYIKPILKDGAIFLLMIAFGSSLTWTSNSAKKIDDADDNI